MPTSSIWKRNFCVFSGLVMETSFENGISVSFWAFLENKVNIFYLKTEFPCFFWACDGNLIWKRDFSVFSGISGKSCQYLLFENGISLFFGLWWQPLATDINIFYLKTEFPCFFWACDGNLIWKRDFRVFFAFLENNANIFYLKTDFPFFWLVMGTSGK